jgi:hypothetical protein
MNWTKYWIRERNKLKKVFLDKGITTCEVCIEDVCFYDNYLGFAHRYKRKWYYEKDKRHLLGDFNHVILACNPCHFQLERDKYLTRDYFRKLRPDYEEGH